MINARPFSIDIPDEVLSKIRAKLESCDWPVVPEGGGWEYGADRDYMKELLAYWLDEYDWRAFEKKLNRFSHFKTDIDGLDIHFIHEKGSGPSPMPLLISHGWPGSIFEFQNIIEPLAHPERFGGRAEDAFDVIVPSLPGFGFSDAPLSPIGPRKIADMFAALMTEGLGYTGFMAQGGDWGSVISSWLGREHSDHCKAVHINMFGLPGSARPDTEQEISWAKQARRIFAAESAYFQLQSTFPVTLSYAMMDSPLGVAAWIIEKFYRWSDLKGGDLGSVYSKDDLLSNIMIYLTTGSFDTATWIYYGHRQEREAALSGGNVVGVPTAAAVFPAEFIPWPPQSHAAKSYNITRWTEMPHGGHFAAMEAPELLVDDIRAFARSIR